MGNALSPCLQSNSQVLVKLVFWGGTTRLLTENQLAGEVMFDFPDRIVCHANSFYIGRPLPVLSMDDELLTGESYFILPMDRFPFHTLTVASLASLSYCTKPPRLSGVGHCPFEYEKGSDGRPLIKVLPEFITRAITIGDDGQSRGDGGGDTGGRGAVGPLCSTPELQKHYAQLVGPRERPWSPKLETISESKNRSSPGRFLGLQWR